MDSRKFLDGMPLCSCLSWRCCSVTFSDRKNTPPKNHCPKWDVSTFLKFELQFPSIRESRSKSHHVLQPDEFKGRHILAIKLLMSCKGAQAQICMV